MDELIKTIILQSPNFIGFIFALYGALIVVRRLIEQNNRLIDAILKRENCEDESAPPA